MSKIKVLSIHEAQKIAAGEVIERPGHVVKELIENSLDAGASKISLYIEKAGKKLIRVVDNGCGMVAEDALLCVQSHATSKITTLHDLTTISTFGFRGEGLASIAAISKLTIRSRTSESVAGTQLYLEGNTLISNTTVACPVGTEMLIEELFFNTPVRKKFLKQDETEWNQIQQLIHAFALVRQNVHFTLYHDDKLILNAPPVDNLKDRITQLWEHNFAQNMMSLSEDATITGAISNHHFWRYGRHQIFFFVNNRWVKNSELSKALLAGYRNVLPPGKFPAAFIFITVSPELVDVNVHPKKEEVRFAKQGALLSLLESLVRKTLEGEVNKQITSPSIKAFVPPVFTSSPTDSHAQRIEFKQSPSILPPFTHNLPSTQHQVPTLAIKQFEQKLPIPQIHTNESVFTENNEFCIIGQILSTYILTEQASGLVIIDQHAAHERILYEKMRANFEKKEGTQLLFPQIIDLSRHQIELLCHEQDFFVDQGIEFMRISDAQVRITATPTDISGTSLKELIIEIATFLQENEFLDREIFRKRLNEHVHSHLACKTAVKAGDKLSMTQMNQLVADLLKTEDRFRCIHGRPTFWVITADELAKKFRRK